MYIVPRGPVALNHIIVLFGCDDSHALRLDPSSQTVAIWVSLKTNQHNPNRNLIEAWLKNTDSIMRNRQIGRPYYDDKDNSYPQIQDTSHGFMLLDTGNTCMDTGSCQHCIFIAPSQHTFNVNHWMWYPDDANQLAVYPYALMSSKDTDAFFTLIAALASSRASSGLLPLFFSAFSTRLYSLLPKFLFSNANKAASDKPRSCGATISLLRAAALTQLCESMYTWKHDNNDFTISVHGFMYTSVGTGSCVHGENLPS